MGHNISTFITGLGKFFQYPVQRKPICFYRQEDFTATGEPVKRPPDVQKVLATDYEKLVDLFYERLAKQRQHNQEMKEKDRRWSTQQVMLRFPGWNEVTIANLHSLFLLFDNQANGMLGLDDFGAILENLGDETSMEIRKQKFNAADTDNDGWITYDEFLSALVGYADSEQYHIFELTKQLPRFSMYTLAEPSLVRKKNTSHVSFHITERVQRICIWLNQNFLLEQEIELQSEDTKELHISILSLRDKSHLDMDFGADGLVKFSTPDIRLAGNLVQSLAIYLNLTDLQSMAQFPEAEKQLREEMAHASQVGETRSRLAAETAERAQLITALLPAAQDAAAHDLKEMLNRYKEVVMLNEELLTGCHIRRATQEQAVASLKSLHTILQQAARLRVGKHSKAVVAASRQAVRDNNVEGLIKIMQVGDS